MIINKFIMPMIIIIIHLNPSELNLRIIFKLKITLNLYIKY